MTQFSTVVLTSSIIAILLFISVAEATKTTVKISSVGVEHFVEEPTVIRKSRQADTKPYSEADKTILLKKHNEYRSKTPGSNMLEMQWHTGLEKSADVWAKKCAFRHPDKNIGEKRTVGDWEGLGQNLYAGNHFNRSDIGYPIKLWFDEIADYTYSTNVKCVPGKMCGHYTQVVWAKSEFVGCAVAYCANLQFVAWGKGYLVVCDYGPPGNYIGQYPYKQGKACSECPKEKKNCINELCTARDPKVTGGADSISATSTLTLVIGVVLVNLMSQI